jgi:hypothetical protein
MIKKKIDLGEYIVKIFYNEETSELDVEVVDELGDIIESINIQDDNSEDEDEEDNSGFSLN